MGPRCRLARHRLPHLTADFLLAAIAAESDQAFRDPCSEHHKRHSGRLLNIRRGVTFWLQTMASSVRERNLRGTPWLTMVIAEGDHPEHIAVIIEGPAEVAAPPQAPGDVRAVRRSPQVEDGLDRSQSGRLLLNHDPNARAERLIRRDGTTPKASHDRSKPLQPTRLDQIRDLETQTDIPLVPHGGKI